MPPLPPFATASDRSCAAREVVGSCTTAAREAYAVAAVPALPSRLARALLQPTAAAPPPKRSGAAKGASKQSAAAARAPSPPPPPPPPPSTEGGGAAASDAAAMAAPTERELPHALWAALEREHNPVLQLLPSG